MVKAKKGTVTLTFDIPGPEAAFAFYHDEKNLNKIEKGFLGIPKSGIALSNWNYRSRPKYEKAVIKVSPQQKLKIKYF